MDSAVFVAFAGVAPIEHEDAAVEGVGLAVARILPRLGSVEVPVVRVLVDERIGARVRVNRVRADEVRAGEVVPEMAVHGVDEKKFAVLVPVVAPRIRGAAAQYFYGPALRMVAPDRAAQRNALFGRRPRHTELARARRATAPIKPAIGAESQAVGKGVVHI